MHPQKPLCNKFLITTEPIELGLLLAPISATEFGFNRGLNLTKLDILIELAHPFTWACSSAG